MKANDDYKWLPRGPPSLDCYKIAKKIEKCNIIRKYYIEKC